MRGPDYISREEWNAIQRKTRRRKSVWFLGATLIVSLATASIMSYPKLLERQHNSKELNRLQVFVKTLQDADQLTMRINRLDVDGKPFQSYEEHYDGPARLIEWSNKTVAIYQSPDFNFYRDQDRVVSFPPSTISNQPMRARVLQTIQQAIDSESPVAIYPDSIEIRFEDRFMRFKHKADRITEVEFHGETDSGLVPRVRVALEYTVDSNYIAEFKATEDAEKPPMYESGAQAVEIFDLSTNQLGDIFMHIKADPRSMIEVVSTNSAHYQAAINPQRRGQTFKSTLFSGLTQTPKFPFTVTIKVAPSRFSGEIFEKKVTFEKPDCTLLPLNWMGDVLDENEVWRHFQARNVLKATADSRKYYASDGTLYHPKNREVNSQLARKPEDQDAAVLRYQRALNYMEEGFSEVIRSPEDLYWEIHLIETELGNRNHALSALKRAKAWADIKGNSSPFTVFIVAAYKREF